MIYVTGDLHGDLARFRSKSFKKIRRRDILIVCGDFGFIWDGSKKEEKILKKLGRKKYSILFLDGANDNMDLIEQYPETPWNGGTVREISGKLKYLCRGSVFSLDRKKIFTFGGGENGRDSESVHKRPWHSRIQPSQAEIIVAEKSLTAHNYQVDFILSHQGGRKIKSLLTQKDSYLSELDLFLDQVRAKSSFTAWFFGGLHKDVFVPPKERCIFLDVLALDEPLLPQHGGGKKRS